MKAVKARRNEVMNYTFDNNLRFSMRNGAFFFWL